MVERKKYERKSDTLSEKFYLVSTHAFSYSEGNKSDSGPAQSFSLDVDLLTIGVSRKHNGICNPIDFNRGIFFGLSSQKNLISKRPLDNAVSKLDYRQ